MNYENMSKNIYNEIREYVKEHLNIKIMDFTLIIDIILILVDGVTANSNISLYKISLTKIALKLGIFLFSKKAVLIILVILVFCYVVLSLIARNGEVNKFLLKLRKEHSDGTVSIYNIFYARENILKLGYKLFHDVWILLFTIDVLSMPKKILYEKCSTNTNRTIFWINSILLLIAVFKAIFKMENIPDLVSNLSGIIDISGSTYIKVAKKNINGGRICLVKDSIKKPTVYYLVFTKRILGNNLYDEKRAKKIDTSHDFQEIKYHFENY